MGLTAKSKLTIFSAGKRLTATNSPLLRWRYDGCSDSGPGKVRRKAVQQKRQPSPHGRTLRFSDDRDTGSGTGDGAAIRDGKRSEDADTMYKVSYFV
ncbi:hypothetical protein ElyMa_003199100 [Elysia marginata]|uniref:Uncharacterized protein n=1 Tax=Elysia marginata TaxID=1093978 RepID=A0AAV4J375_9GAST|nr:hypothetical protein ElyMa_003199100 [Elysia marginata]